MSTCESLSDFPQVFLSDILSTGASHALKVLVRTCFPRPSEVLFPTSKDFVSCSAVTNRDRPPPSFRLGFYGIINGEFLRPPVFLFRFLYLVVQIEFLSRLNVYISVSRPIRLLSFPRMDPSLVPRRTNYDTSSVFLNAS